MTALTVGIGLDWVTFTDDDPWEQCQFRLGKCPNQATHAGIYQIIYGCRHPRILYCLAHRDVILDRSRRHNGEFVCRTICGPDSRIRLLRMERLS